MSTATVADIYDQGAKGYNQRHAGRQSRKYQRIEASMRAQLRHGQVLDLGCGTGRLTPSKRGVGIDVSLEMLKQAPATLSRVCADGHHLPFADGSFDTVIAAQGVIRYMQPAQFMPEVFRVLRPGGHFTAHQFGSVFSLRKLRRIKGELDIESPSELTSPAEAAGFQTVEVELWRPIKAYPFALRVPPWMPGQLWTHCVTHFEKPAGK